MLVTLDGIVTDVRPLQPENAPLPMLVTLDGIVTDVNPPQPRNAERPMLVTGTPSNSDGMTRAPFVDEEIARFRRVPISALPCATE